MDHKTFSAFTLKSDAAQGIVESIVAVMGNADQGDDVIHPGAFTKSIMERRGKIRVLDQHQTDSIMRAIGTPLDLREIGRSELPQELLAQYPTATGGLYAKTQYLMNTPEGRGAFERIAGGAVGEYSIGYDSIPADTDYSHVKSPDGSTRTLRNLRAIKLYEYSPVLFAMNSATQTLSTKDQPSEGKPWDVFHESDKWNVYKLEGDGKPTGDALGEHDTEEEARAPGAALYANEGKATKSVDLTTYVQEVTEAFNDEYGMDMNMPMSECFCVWRVYDDHIVVCEMMSDDYYSVLYTVTNGEYQFATQDTWVEGSLEFVADMTSTGEMKQRGKTRAAKPITHKAGRVMAQRNVDRIMSAMQSLMAALADAGIDTSNSTDTTTTDQAPAEGQAAKSNPDQQAGSSVMTPTIDELKMLEIELNLSAMTMEV